MDADDLALKSMLEGKRQYVVPLFQRPYTWEKKQWDVLWDDILGIYSSSSPQSHFMGSVVSVPQGTNPASASKYLLVDGQQRLTTLLILLSAIRDRATQTTPNSNLNRDIQESYLTNRFVEEGDTYKLLPSELDRASFNAVMGSEPVVYSHLMSQCKRWCLDRLSEKDENGADYDLKRLTDAVVSNLVLVSISLGPNENPYLIFETLNAKGTPLNQADLIRNYMFMKVDGSHQNQVYHGKWIPMQTLIGEDNLPEFFRHFLLKDGGSIKVRDVYITLKDRYADKSPSDFVHIFDQLATYAGFYRKLLHPGEETDPEISEKLKQLSVWDMSTAFPLLLRLFFMKSQDLIDKQAMLQMLSHIESFIVRRSVCNYPSRSLHRYFPSVSASIDATDPVVSLVNGLKRYGWPDDNAFAAALRTYPIFGNSARRVLTTLERSYRHKEPPDLSGTQIEHIMPQTLTPEWIQALGANYENIHQTWLHTLGNLTLTGYNPELSNRSYSEKKKYFAESNLELNKSIASTFDKWDEQTISERAESLAKDVISIWAKP